MLFLFIDKHTTGNTFEAFPTTSRRSPSFLSIVGVVEVDSCRLHCRLHLAILQSSFPLVLRCHTVCWEWSKKWGNKNLLHKVGAKVLATVQITPPFQSATAPDLELGAYIRREQGINAGHLRHAAVALDEETCRQGELNKTWFIIITETYWAVHHFPHITVHPQSWFFYVCRFVGLFITTHHLS